MKRACVTLGILALLLLAAAAQDLAKPGDALAAFLPAALVPLYLKRPDPPLYRRQLVFLRAAICGRL